MDGASKFVRGDAIAGLVVTAINLLGGMILGMGSGMSLVEAARRFSVLTVGDGLVSQIPALIIATSAGMLVTKAGSKVSLGREISNQFTGQRQALTTGAVILGLLALTPGLPKIPFLLLSAGLFMTVRVLKKNQAAEDAREEEAPAEVVAPIRTGSSWRISCRRIESVWNWVLASSHSWNRSDRKA